MWTKCPHLLQKNKVDGSKWIRPSCLLQWSGTGHFDQHHFSIVKNCVYSAFGGFRYVRAYRPRICVRSERAIPITAYQLWHLFLTGQGNQRIKFVRWFPHTRFEMITTASIRQSSWIHFEFNHFMVLKLFEIHGGTGQNVQCLFEWWAIETWYITVYQLVKVTNWFNWTKWSFILEWRILPLNIWSWTKCPQLL